METGTRLILSNKTYDVLKFVAQILLPGLGTLYFGLAQIWGLPKAEEVVGTITVIDTFLGLMLGLSSSAYSKSDAKYVGTIDVEHREDGKKVFMLGFENDPEALDTHDEVLFKIHRIQ